MYAFIRGTLVSNVDGTAVVETAGIGYRITVASSLPAPGEELLLHLSHVVRETSQTLYGFLTASDRDLFEVLTTISGIGPKTALGIVDNLPGQMLQEAILQGNPTLLSKVPGIGKKTAERLLVELRGKVLPQGESSKSFSTTGQDAIQALMNLGYPLAKAQSSVQKVLDTKGDDIELSKLITAALKQV